MNIAFLYLSTRPYDAIVEWVHVLARHAKDVVYHAPTVHDAITADFVFMVTQQEVYPPGDVNLHLEHLRAARAPFAVVHNQDNPGVPRPGDYPSFAWTQTAMRRLSAYSPVLVRQPVLPRVVEPKERPLHLGTFGRIEPKKHTLQMAALAMKLGIPFTAFTAEPLTQWSVGDEEVRAAKRYIDHVQELGGEVVVHPWLERIEQLADLCDQVSHWLFVLPPSKEGTGGSCTCPRYATAFGRPVVVVDDEDTFLADGFGVTKALSGVTIPELQSVAPVRFTPLCDWTPDRYVRTLADLTAKFWEGKR